MEQVEKAIEAIKNGQFVIVFDDIERENEGDLIMAASKMTSEKMSFLLKHTSGLVCVPMIGERLDALEIPLMVRENSDSFRTAFTVSVDFHNTTTGISAKDRAATVAALADPQSSPQDFRRPGHIFPLRAKKGGVLKRGGHTEAAVDLALMAGLEPVSVLCEIVNEDRSMARMPELTVFAKKHNLVMISVADLIRYRRKEEKFIKLVSTANLPTAFGEFKALAYESILDGCQHLALVKGEINPKEEILVRVHSECLTGDIFGSKRCDCGDQLQKSLEIIAKEGRGIIVYLRGQEGRGIGLGHKLRAYSLQERGFDTVDANLELGLPIDCREYGIGSQILADIGAGKIRLLTNNPAKYGGISGYGLEIVERVPLVTKPTLENINYLKTKQKKLGHILHV